jgi:hypothetical protein
MTSTSNLASIMSMYDKGDLWSYIHEDDQVERRFGIREKDTND